MIVSLPAARPPHPSHGTLEYSNSHARAAVAAWFGPGDAESLEEHTERDAELEEQVRRLVRRLAVPGGTAEYCGGTYR